MRRACQKFQDFRLNIFTVYELCVWRCVSVCTRATWEAHVSTPLHYIVSSLFLSVSSCESWNVLLNTFLLDILRKSLAINSIRWTTLQKLWIRMRIWILQRHRQFSVRIAYTSVYWEASQPTTKHKTMSTKIRTWKCLRSKLHGKRSTRDLCDTIWMNLLEINDGNDEEVFVVVDNDDDGDGDDDVSNVCSRSPERHRGAKLVLCFMSVSEWIRGMVLMWKLWYNKMHYRRISHTRSQRSNASNIFIYASHWHGVFIVSLRRITWNVLS